MSADIAIHDSDCRGCATRKRLREEGSAAVMDYLAYCDKCGVSIQGCYEHRINREDYCDRCAKTLLLTTKEPE